MIVRIMEAGQYRLNGDATLREFTKLDQRLLEATQRHDEKEFARTLRQLIALVKAQGRELPLEELLPSEVIVPAEDMSMAEATALLVAP
jgi:hypothetical protein